jgi:hypothetical protein
MNTGPAQQNSPLGALMVRCSNWAAERRPFQRRLIASGNRSLIRTYEVQDHG